MRPIHYDRDYAQAAGYPTVFSVGMLQAGILATYVADRVGPANLRRISVRFEEQVWPGDQLTYRGLPLAGTESGQHLIDLRVTRRAGTAGTGARPDERGGCGGPA